VKLKGPRRTALDPRVTAHRGASARFADSIAESDQGFSPFQCETMVSEPRARHKKFAAGSTIHAASRNVPDASFFFLVVCYAVNCSTRLRKYCSEPPLASPPRPLIAAIHVGGHIHVHVSGERETFQIGASSDDGLLAFLASSRTCRMLKNFDAVRRS